MTRETKIGLLVGLAFIIVIGILLSDHLTSSTEPPPATLANAGNNVRQTVTTPGSNTPAPPITTVATGPQQQQQQVAPQQPVPTPNELQPKPQPVQIVQVGGPGIQQPQMQVSQAQNQVQPDQTPGAADDAPVITQVPPSNVPGSLAQTAQQHGEALVPLDSSGRPTQSGSAPAWTSALNGTKEYKAEPGDSVSKMAMKLLGANTKANRDAIVRANASLQQDPNKVIVGRTYMIPSAGVADTGQATMTVAQAPPQPVQSQQMQAPGAQLTSAAEYWYTVKENDSLWRIASEQLGSSTSIAAIKELNKDALKGSDTVYVGMKLKLPGKPVAKAN